MGVLRKAGDGDAPHQTAQHRQKRRLTVIPLDGKVTGLIGLRRGDAEHHCAVLAGAAAHLDAEPLHGVQRQPHVGAAFKGRRDLDGTGLLHQRRGKQKATDELAGHIPRHPEGTRL